MMSTEKEITFKKSASCKISLSAEDWEQGLGSPEKLAKNMATEDSFAFDILENGKVIGFAVLLPNKNDRYSYFIWDFAIDQTFQNQGRGTAAFHALLELLRSEYRANRITLTYLDGNDRARHVYEKLGFTEFNRFVEPDPLPDEIDMELLFNI